jgi:hypothetical protein
MQKYDVASIKVQLAADISGLTKTLFPSRPIKPAHDGWRVGNNGSMAIKRNGVFCCHETGSGGDVFDLIQYALATDFRGALAWAKMYLGGRATVSAQRTEQNRPAQCEADLARKRKQTAKAKSIWMQSQAPIDWRPSCSH